MRTYRTLRFLSRIHWPNPGSVASHENVSVRPRLLNIHGGTFLSEDVAEQIGDTLVQRLQRELRFYALLHIGATYMAGLFSAETQRQFDKFEQNANKSAPSHPLDQQRWRDFVITSHQENEPKSADIYTELVKRGWPDETAEKLAIDYEKGRDLLDDYDSRI